MRYYETLYFMAPNLADEDYKEAIAKFNAAVGKHGGVPIKIDEWGKRTLAYEVKKFDRGFYVLMSYCGGPEAIAELKRELRLDDRVLKHQTVKLADNVDAEALRRAAEEERTGGSPAAAAASEEDEAVTETADVAEDDENGDA